MVGGWTLFEVCAGQLRKSSQTRIGLNKHIGNRQLAMQRNVANLYSPSMSATSFKATQRTKAGACSNCSLVFPNFGLIQI